MTGVSESRFLRSENSTRALLVLVLSGVFAATFLDFVGFFNSFPFVLIGATIVALAVFGLAYSFSLNRCMIVFIALVWAFALPQIRWNFVKAFYLDCKTLSEGMSVDHARAAMSDYHLQRELAESSGEEPGLGRAHLTFHPSLDRSADWCVVYFAGDRVTSVELMRD